MIFEFIRHLLMIAPDGLKELGYGRELLAIAARHSRCGDAWAPHLETCRGLISEAAKDCPGREHVVVLGSGYLFDVPVEILSEIFGEVWLVDVIHPPQALDRAKNLSNIRFIERDLSGVASALLRVGHAGSDELPCPNIDLDDLADADLVVSSNLLSQLPLVPLDFVGKCCSWASAEVRQKFAYNIVDHHLAVLQKLMARVVVITEVMRLIHDSNEVVERIDPLFGITFPYQGREWTWDIAPRPEIDRHFDLSLQMVGVMDLAAAPHNRSCRNTNLAAP